MKTNVKKYIKLLASFLTAAVLFYFLLRQVSWAGFAAHFSEIDWRYWFLALFLYFAANLIRTYRFSLLLDGGIGFGQLFHIVFIHNFFNSFLPFRLGEVSYVYLVGKNKKVGFGHNVASLVSVRFFDMVSVLSIIIVFIALVGESRIYSENIIFLSLLTLFATFAVFASLIFLGRVMGNFLVYKFVGFMGNTRFKYISLAFEKIRQVLESFSILQSKKLLFGVMFLSFIFWFIIFCTGWLLMLGLGIELPFSKIMVAYSLPVITSITPIQLVGGFGSYEVPLAGILILFGIPKESAIVSSILLHLQELFFVIILGIWGLVWYALFRKRYVYE